MSNTGRLTLKEAPVVEKCYCCETHDCMYCEHFNRIVHRLYNLENHFEALGVRNLGNFYISEVDYTVVSYGAQEVPVYYKNRIEVRN